MSPWRVASVAGAALLAAAVVVAGVYLVIHPVGSTNHAVAAQRQHARAPQRSAVSPLPPLKLGELGTYSAASARFTLTRSAAGLAPRALRISVRYPVVPRLARYRRASHGLFPLIVFAPGFRHCAGVYRDLLRQWATAGYVVAAVDFPQTSCRVAVPDEADVTHQPADVAFVIARLLARSAAPHGPLAGLIAPGEIAVAGHSDGGDTAAALAGASCCRDRRVRAAVILSGAQWPAFSGPWFARQAPPLLVIQGTADPWNPPADSVRLYQADTTGPRYYLDLPGANHFSPYQGEGSPEPIVARVTVDFLDRYVLGQRDQTAAMLRAANVVGKAVLASAGRLPK